MSTRFAVLGLYNSGSTTLAGMLHRLGANMGAPFWTDSEDDSPGNYYESHDLAWHLRNWWDEPYVEEKRSAAERRRYLRAWMELQESVGSQPVGVKHPLLSLCTSDLMTAWGPGTVLIWSHRDLDASVAGLLRRGWYPGHAAAIQRRLWRALTCAAEQFPENLHRVCWESVKRDPAATARRLAGFAGLEPSAEQIRRAAGFVRQA